MAETPGAKATSPARDIALKDPIATTPEVVTTRLQTPKPQISAPQTGAASQAGSSDGSMPIPDFTALSQNLARLVEQGGKAAAAYFRPLEDGRTNTDMADQVEDAVKTLGHVAEHWLSDPSRALEAQTKISGDMLELWARTLRKMSGEDTQPLRAPDPGDKRFADPEWKKK